MRVLIGPGVDLSPGNTAATVAAALAGDDGTVVSLGQVGLASWTGRSLSAAETADIRTALGWGGGPRVGEDVKGLAVAYVCTGRPTGVTELPAEAVVAVTDHVGLTWDSPLVGPNDERVGPRFPRVDEVYLPEMVTDRGACLPGVTITAAVVAGVRDQDALSTWERAMVETLAVPAVSATLVPVAIVAAHMGVRVAAAVLL